MAAYLTRVELHGASYQDYQNLHSYMREAGFMTIIHADNGAVYTLPPAEYYYLTSADVPAEAVRDHARNAANRTGILNAVLTAKTAGIAWSGLAPAQALPVNR